MFSYYGSKSKIVDYYPPPKFKKIIEPFAGSGRYSLKYWENDILLVDKYPVIIDIWKWLQQCSKNDILKLPILKAGDKINREDFDCIEQANFYGFIISTATRNPKLTVSPFGEKKIKSELKKISENLHKIKHWEVLLGSYEDINNQESTWFIDPPYQFGGEHYVKSNKQIDFEILAEWCKSRNGQVIVCENTKANWLPFKPMIDMQGAIYKTTEAIWSNQKTNYDNQQISLF
jgi:site-specific DNA-adenine methylase